MSFGGFCSQCGEAMPAEDFGGICVDCVVENAREDALENARGCPSGRGCQLANASRECQNGRPDSRARARAHAHARTREGAHTRAHAREGGGAEPSRAPSRHGARLRKGG